jgi:flagellar basal-body rod protein FlgB
VQILDNIFSGHSANLQQAMGRTTKRHSMLTANLANVNTPGYKRKDVDFNILLDEQMKAKPRRQELLDRAAQRASDRSSILSNGNNVDLEREILSLAETELRYQTLADMTARYFSGLKNVIREGR